MTTDRRLSPAEFRAIVARKGWTLTDLAGRWNISLTWLSQVASDRDREIRWDDMLRGLPAISRAEMAVLRRQRLAATRPRRTRTPERTNVAEPGYRYQGDLEIGSVLALADDLGDFVAGDKGVVRGIKDTGDGCIYQIAFGGMVDWFAPDDIDRMLVSTGEVVTP